MKWIETEMVTASRQLEELEIKIEAGTISNGEISKISNCIKQIGELIKKTVTENAGGDGNGTPCAQLMFALIRKNVPVKFHREFECNFSDIVDEFGW